MSKMTEKSKTLLQSRDLKVLAKLEATGTALFKGVNGQTFQDAGLSLKVDDSVRPIQDLTKPGIEFVIPLTVEYSGSGSPEQWQAVELAAEAAVLAAVAPQFAKAKLIRRTKTDPYRADPRSLTFLRYQA